jgi:hypothetical protein
MDIERSFSPNFMKKTLTGGFNTSLPPEKTRFAQDAE